MYLPLDITPNGGPVMPRGRMISKSICRSGQVNSLSSDLSRLTFTWLIPWQDVEGRIDADPIQIKLNLFKHRKDVTVAKIGRILQELDDAKLIVLYEANGNQYAWFPGFNKHQQGLRKEREAVSEIPPFDGSSSELTPGVTPGVTPAESQELLRAEVQVQVQVQSKRECKGLAPRLEPYPGVLLTEDEHAKLVTAVGEEYIKDFGLQKQAKGYTYKSDFAAIQTWKRNDEKREAKNGNGQKLQPRLEVDNEHFKQFSAKIDRDAAERAANDDGTWPDVGDM
jgi:hypothetical protein